jgi:hypothetical protein
MYLFEPEKKGVPLDSKKKRTKYTEAAAFILIVFGEGQNRPFFCAQWLGDEKSLSCVVDNMMHEEKVGMDGWLRFLFVGAELAITKVGAS